MAEREAELLPVAYFHLVYTLPPPIADIAHQNKQVIYDLLFKAAHETTVTIAGAMPLRKGEKTAVVLIETGDGYAVQLPADHRDAGGELCARGLATRS